jgi:hypothetical protein
MNTQFSKEEQMANKREEMLNIKEMQVKTMWDSILPVNGYHQESWLECGRDWRTLPYTLLMGMSLSLGTMEIGMEVP